MSDWQVIDAGAHRFAHNDYWWDKDAHGGVPANNNSTVIAVFFVRTYIYIAALVKNRPDSNFICIYSALLRFIFNFDPLGAINDSLICLFVLCYDKLIILIKKNVLVYNTRKQNLRSGHKFCLIPSGARSYKRRFWSSRIHTLSRYWQNGLLRLYNIWKEDILLWVTNIHNKYLIFKQICIQLLLARRCDSKQSITTNYYTHFPRAFLEFEVICG